MTDIARARVRVQGRVQGVFYRQSTKDKAQQLGLSGWVRNERDGSVQFEAAGTKAAVERLIEWARKGPPSSRVDEISVEWIEQIGEVEGRFSISR